MTQHSVEKLGFKSYLLSIHLNFTITWACQSLHSWNLFTTCKCMQISKIQSTYTARKFSFSLKTVISFDQLPEIQENRNESLTMPQWSCSYLEISQNLHFTTCKLPSSSSPHSCLPVVVYCLVNILSDWYHPGESRSPSWTWVLI